MSASSGTSPVTAIAYSAAGQPTQVTLGKSGTDLGDYQTFSYDPNTFHRQDYTFYKGGPVGPLFTTKYVGFTFTELLYSFARQTVCR